MTWVGPRWWDFFFSPKLPGQFYCVARVGNHGYRVSLTLSSLVIEHWNPGYLDNIDPRYFHSLILDITFKCVWVRHNKLEWGPEESQLQCDHPTPEPQEPSWRFPPSLFNALEQMDCLHQNFAIFNLFDDLREDSPSYCTEAFSGNL